MDINDPGPIRAKKPLITALAWIVAVVALGLTIKVLSDIKAKSVSAPLRTFPRFGTTDLALRAAIEDNDFDAIKRRLADVPPSALRKDFVNRIANRPKVLDAALTAGLRPSGTGATDALLFAAIRNNEPEAAEVLLRHGANPNSVQGGLTVLTAATQEFHGFAMGTMHPMVSELPTTDTHGQIVKALLAAGAKPDGECEVNAFINGEARTVTTRPLIEAVKVSNYEAAKYLLVAGADPNWQIRGEAPPIILSQQRTISAKLTSLLLDHKAKIDAEGRIREPGGRGPIQATALFFAAGCGDLETVKLLLSHGADPKKPASHGKTPIEAATGEVYAYFHRARGAGG